MSFSKLQVASHLKKAGILSMAAYMENEVLYLYMAQASSYSWPTHKDDRTVNINNHVSVAGFTWKTGTWATNDTVSKVLAGLGSALKKVTSIDNVGEKASLRFTELGKGGSYSRYGGASLYLLIDPRTKRKYLMIGEGASHKLRMMDVHDNNPASIKLTTLGSFVGVREIAPGATADQVYVFDEQGVLSSMDIEPAIKCGNLDDFFGPAMHAWGNDVKTKVAYTLGPEHKTYHLRRAAASKNAKSFPWELTAQKKSVPVIGVKEGRVVKMTLCARASNTGTMRCCVNKASVGHRKALSKAERALLKAALVKI